MDTAAHPARGGHRGRDRGPRGGLLPQGRPGAGNRARGTPRLGGKLSASDVAGVAMDEGAEALLARRPEGIGLITAAGLGGNLVPAGVTSSAVYTRGAMRPLPRRQFMGVPADLDELAATGGSRRRASRAPGPRRMRRPRAATLGHRLRRQQAGRRGRRPAGRPAARRRLRWPVRGLVVRRHPRSARRRGPRPRRADRGGHLRCCRPSQVKPRQVKPRLVKRRVTASPGPRSSSRSRPGSARFPRRWRRRPAPRSRTGTVVRELARPERGLAAHHRIRRRPGAPRRRCGDTRRSRRALARLLAAVPGASAAVTALGEISYASMAIVTSRLPPVRVPRAGARRPRAERLPGACRGRAGGQGGHLLHR